MKPTFAFVVVAALSGCMTKDVFPGRFDPVGYPAAGPAAVQSAVLPELPPVPALERPEPDLLIAQPQQPTDSPAVYDERRDPAVAAVLPSAENEASLGIATIDGRIVLPPAARVPIIDVMENRVALEDANR